PISEQIGLNVNRALLTVIQNSDADSQPRGKQRIITKNVFSSYKAFINTLYHAVLTDFSTNSADSQRCRLYWFKPTNSLV
uniref:Myosin motor domain-containing protein n=1 Tax=Steinernema glaseri TaxID=37863 RepID=A0A1I8AEE2_9BILA